MPDWTEHEIGPYVLIESIVVGLAEANCYILGCGKTGACAVIDPGTITEKETSQIVSEVGRLGFDVIWILNTHAHPDHFSGNDAVRAALGGKVLIHSRDALKLIDADLNCSSRMGLDITVSAADGSLNDGEIVWVGEIGLTVLHTPGHSSGGAAFLGDGFVFTGDTLFAGSVGRTDLPGGCLAGEDAWEVLMRSIHERLLTLPEETIVLPGHGPATSIGREKRTNPFLM